MRRYRRIIIILICIATYAAAEWLAYRSTVPPQKVNDFASFVAWRSPGEVEVMQQAGKEYLLATAGGGALLPSGKSGYIFDKSGRLVDWSSDMGDDSRFQKKWNSSSRGTLPRLNTDAAFKWIGGEQAKAG